jgi:hypothetical protein
MTNKQTDELAALKARIEELERANKPSEFKPEPFERYDPTANMSMPRSVMEEMARAVPDGVMKEVGLRDARLSPTERPGTLPHRQQPATSPRPSAGDGTGWAHEIPLSNPPGTHLVDAIAIADDVRQRKSKA